MIFFYQLMALSNTLYPVGNLHSIVPPAMPQKSKKISLDTFDESATMGIFDTFSESATMGIFLIVLMILIANAVGSEIVADQGNVPNGHINGTDTYCWIENHIAFNFVTWLKVNGGLTLGIVAYLI